MPGRRYALPLIVWTAVAAPAFGAGNSYDGTYTGERVRTGGNPSACVAKDPVSVVIHGDNLTFKNSVKHGTIAFSPRADGWFRQVSDASGYTVFIRGRIGGGVLDGDVISGHCSHHWHLEKQH